MMENPNFSQIRTAEDIARMKASLRHNIAVKENVLKNDISRVHNSFSVLGIMGRTVSYVTGFSRKKSPLALFTLGFKIAKSLIRWRKK